MAEETSDPYVQVKLRMRESFRAKLLESAKARGVSLNAAIVDCLSRSFEEPEEPARGGSYSEMVDEMARAFRRGLEQGARHQVKAASVRDLDDLAQGLVNVPDRSLDDLAQDRWCYAHAMNYVAAALDAYMPLGDVGEGGELTEKREAENEFVKFLAGKNARRTLDRQQGEDEGDGDSGHD